MKFEEKVKKLLDEALEADNSLFLIDFSIGQGNVIKVVIDGVMEFLSTIVFL